MNVLICDDSGFARKQLARALPKEWAITLHQAANGIEGLEQILMGHGDLVLLDLTMPEMDGYTLTAEVKAHEHLKNVHIVLHSSLSGVFNEAMVKKVGADQFIAKFHPDELASAVQHWMAID